MRRIIFIMSLVMVFSLAGIRSSVLASDTQSQRETHKGLKGIYVSVQDLDQDIKQEGLYEAQIQTDVELKLRWAGIKVLTQKELYEEKGEPVLHIFLITHKLEKGVFQISLFIGVLQNVSLVRNNTITDAITLSKFGIGIQNNIRGIRDYIKDSIDDFINGYLSVNP